MGRFAPAGALQWACGAGILSGDTNGDLNSSATRAEIAAMLERFVEKAAATN